METIAAPTESLRFAMPGAGTNLPAFIRESARVRGERVAIIDRGRHFTYRELDREIDLAAGAWSRVGIGPGSVVGLLCTNRAEWISAAVGAMRLGARVAAFHTFARAWDLAELIEHSQCEALLCLDHFRSRDFVATLSEVIPELSRVDWRSQRLPALRELIVLGESELPPGARRWSSLCRPSPAPESARSRVAAVGSEEIAFVLYTSGSSARPKAVPLRHDDLLENGFQIGERMALQSQDRVLCSVPLFWSYGASNALPATFTHGAALVLQEAFEPAQAVALIEEHQVTAVYTLPHMTSAMLASPGFAAPRTRSLRTGLTLGSPEDVRRAAVELAAPRICNIYGQTETYGNCCVTPARWPLADRATSQGPPLPGVQLRVQHPNTRRCAAPGEVGELEVRGRVVPGYLNGPAEADQVFTSDGWYRTGDLGTLDPHGSLRFSARASEMIKVGGINVAPSEVEQWLMRHEAVAAAAATGVADPELGQIVVAFVVSLPGHHPEEHALRDWCGERIAAFKVPARIHIVPDLPSTATGKLARRALDAWHEELERDPDDRAHARRGH
jgi:fatty-acyl-CoA synthase